MKSRWCALLILYMLLNRHSVKCTPGEISESSSGLGSGPDGVQSSGPTSGVSDDSSKSPQQNAEQTIPGNGSSTGTTVSSPSGQPSGGGGTDLQAGSGSAGETHNATQVPGTQIPAIPENAQDQSIEETITSNGGQNGDNVVSTVQNPEQANPQADSATQVAAPPPAITTNPIEVKSSLLKDQKGLKITGPCKSFFQVYLVPYLYMNVNAERSEIEMEPLFMKVDNRIKFEKEKHLLQNICAENKSFKLVLYIYEGELTIKWKVYPPKGESTNDKTVDIRKYKMKDIGQPITSMQVMVMTEKHKTIYVESKNFSVMNDIPEKCDAIANECFMSGVLDIQKCYHCTLLLQKKDSAQECFNFVSPEIRSRFDDIQAKGEDEENPNEVELEGAIDKIFIKIYKKGENHYKEVDQLAIMDSSFKSELLKYCSLMKETDSSGALDNHELGNAEEVFAHITTMLQSNSDLNVYSLKNKLKNPAICLKKVGHWIGSKTGLVLPILEHSSVHDSANTYVETEGSTSNSATTQSADVHLLHVSDKLFCNADYCDWTKDTSSCIAKIEAQDQGDCATSWLFASKVHLETIKCVKGYEHVPSSALYVANCSSKEAKDKCQAASNPLEFLNILEETKFLPAESDLPYSYKAVNNVCPEPKSHWQNLWENVKLLDKQYQPNSVSTKGYTAYQSDHFKGNMDAFNKLVKSEVMNKGSAIAYVKAQGVMSYDLNGKKVLSLCGGETPDLAVNIVGYGNYINGEGVKKSYWLLQNSWGKHWGDKGKFKVDMHGPAHCQQNFIHTAAVFNVDIPVIVPAPNSDPEINNYYLKKSPDFFSNFYFNKLEAESDGNSGGAKNASNNLTVQGQEEPPVVPTEAQASHSGGSGSGQSAGGSANGQVQPGPGTPVPEGSAVGSSPLQTVPSTSLPTNPDASAAPVQQNGGADQQVSPTLPGTPNSLATTGTTGQAPEQPTVQPTPQTVQVPSAQPARAPLSTLTGSTGVIVTEVKEALHFLKNVKNGKVKSNFVSYDNADALGDEKVCSRAFSTDVDKQAECIEFCEKNWDACKDKVSPGYCLTKKRGSNDCFFCFV
ncbi:serine-repeat antigen [Plasmodium cynomolgi strain B]|uniref:Serine-repeat antigen n=2 Tax=Plasmodium cynomolgi TaxID=5827 RepID=K6UCK7_PLACD|nr:serine-repeat antigen [Plasmodium cynomolgi strain B]BAK08403.1 putative papain-like cysteine prorease [Plasmodium cynomolgi]GAB65021.1 serine-repeat antigen [Plasmodium cynomolgi strain B]